MLSTGTHSHQTGVMCETEWERSKSAFISFCSVSALFAGFIFHLAFCEGFIEKERPRCRRTRPAVRDFENAANAHLRKKKTPKQNKGNVNVCVD